MVFDGFEELPKVALAKAAASGSLHGDGIFCVFVLVIGHDASDALNDFEKEGRSIPDGLCKKLQENSFLVGIRQNPQFFQFLVLLGSQLVSQSIWELSVVRVARSFHQFKAAEEVVVVLIDLSHLSDGRENVPCLERQVLKAGALVLFEVGLDLGLASSLGLCKNNG